VLNQPKKKGNKMKYTKGQKVTYLKKLWTVCQGGYSDKKSKVYMYKLCRGATKMLVAGNKLNRQYA
jgi:hypothetical protein